MKCLFRNVAVQGDGDAAGVLLVDDAILHVVEFPLVALLVALPVAA